MINPYSTQYSSIQQMLSQAGYDMSALTDPGSLYGFGEGTQYAQFFRPFDISGYNQAQASLKQLEQNLLSNVGERFSQATTGLRSQIGASMAEISGQAGRSGLISGAMGRRRELAYETGEEKFEEQKRQAQAQYTSVQEQVGTRAGQLEGTLFDFLGGAASTALQLQGMDPTGGARIATREDAQNFVNQLNLSAMDSMTAMGALSAIIGQPYQIMLDKFKELQQGI